MSINKIAFLSLLMTIFITSCSTDSDTFLIHNGNMPSNERIAKLKVGDTKNEVSQNLGAPSTIVSLDEDTWIYMSSDMKRVAFFEPEVIDRDVLKIEFESGKVAKIHRLNKNSGQEILISEDKTQTLGHTPGFFEKFFGGIGGYSPFPVSDPKNNI